MEKMICGAERITDLSTPVATPPSTPAAMPSPSLGYRGSRSSQYSPALQERMAQDKCFKCKQQGHWQRDCHFNSISPEKASSPSPTLPVLRCHCGRAWGSKTAVTTEKEFYSCPKCHVFEMAENVKTPLCPCGAGASALNVRITTKYGPIKFYTCRIKKGHGACGFFELENPLLRLNEEIMRLLLGKGKGQLSQEDDRRLEISSFVNHCEAESSVLNSITRDLIVQEVENSTPIMEEQATHISWPTSRWRIHLRQMEFCNQISAAATEPLNGGSGVHTFGLFDLGWLGRVAFPPSRCLEGYLPKHILYRMFNTLDRICVPDYVDTSKSSISNVLQHSSTSAELDWVTPETSVSAAPESSVVSRSTSPKRSFSEVEEDPSIRSEVKKFGEKLQNELTMILQSFKQLELHASKKAVQVLTQLINSEGHILQAELSSLMTEDSEAYLNSQTQLQSAISQLEEQLQGKKGSNCAPESCNAEDFWFDNVCSIHTHTMAAFTASDEQLRLVNQHVFRIKEILLQIGSQLQACEAETLRFEACVLEISSKMRQAKRTMTAASQYMLSVSKSHQQRNEEDQHFSALPPERRSTSSTSHMPAHEGKRQKLGNFSNQV